MVVKSSKKAKSLDKRAAQPKSQPQAHEARRIQYAALPWRQAAGLEIMLVSSRETKRWIIPKGWPMAGRDGRAVAAIEAIEEAGLLGQMAREPFGHFKYVKRMPKNAALLCEVEVYPLRVQRQREDWPEREMRATQWFPADEAVDLVEEPELRTLLRQFCAQMQLASDI